MKNIFKAGLLAVLFVGMSSFSSNHDSIELLDPCENTANDAYLLVQTFLPATTQGQLTQLWLDVYYSCLDENGYGASNFTVTIQG